MSDAPLFATYPSVNVSGALYSFLTALFKNGSELLSEDEPEFLITSPNLEHLLNESNAA